MRPIVVAAVPLLLLAACDRGPEAEAGPPPVDAPSDAPELGGVDLTGPVNLLGNEPFWGVQIRPDGVLLRAVDRADVTAANPGPRVHGTVAVWRTTSQDGLPMELMVTETACSDGMSDRTYPLAARVRLGDEVLVGCGASADFVLNTDERGRRRD